MKDAPSAKKSLGQHWLHDEASLQAMCDGAGIQATDTVLEIGPGLGTLTKLLVGRAKQVIAVEFDDALAHDLPQRVPAANLQVVRQDILEFDLTTLPPDYKVAANIPYYLTSNLLRVLCESTNPFKSAALLLQKEVAERVCAGPGHMSMLSFSVQFYCEARLGANVPAELFTPPPKVDSRILILNRRTTTLFPDVDQKAFFKLARAGFSQRRKTLVNALSSGLQLERADVLRFLEQAHVKPMARAQELGFTEWHQLYKVVHTGPDTRHSNS
jgi:16S rRNA (adenine1518-N6/adenine1519-N6)-dimethyltransferase